MLSTKYFFRYRPILQEKINFKSVNDINLDVVTRRQFNYAYIFTDSAAEYMDMLLHSYISSAKSYKRTIRIMNEKLSKYTSSIASKHSNICNRELLSFYSSQIHFNFCLVELLVEFYLEFCIVTK